jgi:hypothetical protein
MEPGLSSARSSRDAVVLTDSATRIVAHSAEIAGFGPLLEIFVRTGHRDAGFLRKNLGIQGAVFETCTRHKKVQISLKTTLTKRQLNHCLNSGATH